MGREPTGAAATPRRKAGEPSPGSHLTHNYYPSAFRKEEWAAQSDWGGLFVFPPLSVHSLLSPQHPAGF